MQEFERASFHKEFVDEENNTGSYVFEPLERGFGTTVGSTIKNTMLSNLPGCAVIGFKIEGLGPVVPAGRQARRGGSGWPCGSVYSCFRK